MLELARHGCVALAVAQLHWCDFYWATVKVHAFIAL